MTPPRILRAEFPSGNPVFIAGVFTAVAVTGEPIIEEAITGVSLQEPSALPLPEHITLRAADTILTDRVTSWATPVPPSSDLPGLGLWVETILLA
jgi:hypothetical protein